jgi:hypothetical protein
VGLKRYLAREVYPLLQATVAAPGPSLALPTVTCAA